MAAKIVALICAVAAPALADPSYGYGGVSHVDVVRPYAAYGYGIRHYGKREAEPSYGYGLGLGYGYGLRYGGVALHPTGVSYTQRSPQGLGKRSADAEPEAEAGYLGYGYGGYLGSYSTRVSVVDPYNGAAYNYGVNAIGKRSADAEASYYGYGPAIAYHPYGSSYTYRSVQGLGKRSADAEPSYYGYGPAIAYHPYGSSYTYRSVQGLGKRSAEPSYYGYRAPAASHVAVDRPYASYGYGIAHPY